MSHFSVLVIGPNVEKQLQPYHEYECTGVKDQYVVAVDETEQYQKEYAEATTDVVVMEDGSLRHQFDRQFQLPKNNILDPVEYDYGGRELKTVPISEMYKTFVSFMCDYQGWDLEEHPEIKEGRVIRFTNPNKKWDWWVIGGRWEGFFRKKPGSKGEMGRPGIQTMDENYEPPNSELQASSLLKRDIDLQAMRDEARADAEQQYDRFEHATRGLKAPPPWNQIREKHGEDIDAAREEWNSYPWVKALAAAKIFLLWEDPLEFFCVMSGGREAFIQKKLNHVGVTFAVVKDSKWYQRGDMGFWGIVSDEKDQGVWEEEFQKLLDSVPDDTLLTVVDCHI